MTAQNHLKAEAVCSYMYVLKESVRVRGWTQEARRRATREPRGGQWTQGGRRNRAARDATSARHVRSSVHPLTAAGTCQGSRCAAAGAAASPAGSNPWHTSKSCTKEDALHQTAQGSFAHTDWRVNQGYYSRLWWLWSPYQGWRRSIICETSQDRLRKPEAEPQNCEGLPDTYACLPRYPCLCEGLH